MLKVRVNTALAALGVLPAIIGVQLLSSMLKMLFFGPAWPPEASLFLGISYVAFSLLILKIWCVYVLRLSFEDCGIGAFRLDSPWQGAAVVLPVSVMCCFFLFSGNIMHSLWAKQHTAQILASGVFFTGISVAVVEEFTFRGIILRALETRWHPRTALVLTSLLFGLLHALEQKLPLVETLQVFTAISFLGFMLGAVVLQSGNVWNAVWMHMMWNVLIVGGIIHFGDTADVYSFYSYVMSTRSLLISGGAFGVEASVISVAGYMLFGFWAFTLMQKPVSRAGYNFF